MGVVPYVHGVLCMYDKNSLSLSLSLELSFFLFLSWFSLSLTLYLLFIVTSLISFILVKRYTWDSNLSLYSVFGH